MRNSLFLAVFAVALATAEQAAAVDYPGKEPGKAAATQSGTTYSIGNDLLKHSDIENKLLVPLVEKIEKHYDEGR
jgi:hypothetical protein